MTINSIPIRIRQEDKIRIQQQLPGISWPKRISTIFEFSIIKYQDNLGEAIYGKKMWKKIKTKKN